jgi:hypothetical protein
MSDWKPGDPAILDNAIRVVISTAEDANFTTVSTGN